VGYTANWTAQRHSTIATVAVGYGDGYPRHAPNGTPVLINGVKCPLVGRVSMDMITVDITDLNSDVEIGADVTLWGPELSVTEVAEHCGTIGYELLTRMPARVPRIYINAK
jgi:alanine racemase